MGGLGGSIVKPPAAPVMSNTIARNRIALPMEYCQVQVPYCSVWRGNLGFDLI